MKSYMDIQCDNEFTIVHLSVKHREYALTHYFIDTHGFDVDFYRP